MMRAWIGAGALIGLVCAARPAHAAAAEQGSTATATADVASNPSESPRFRGWHIQPGSDLYFVDHGPEGAFWGFSFGAGVAYRWRHDFVGVRASFYMNVAPYRVELNGVRLQLGDSGPRVGLNVGHEVTNHLWLLGELAPQYDYVSIKAESAVPSIRTRPGLNQGWAMRASLGIGLEVMHVTSLSVSATLAVPFERNHYDVEDTSVPGGVRRVFTASMVQPGISFTLGFF